MAVLKGMGASAPSELRRVDERVEFIVNKNLSNDQKASGVYAKVQVRHPAASFIATVWSKDGRKWVSEPAQEGKRQWFPQVSLMKDIKDYVLHLVDHNEEDNSAWYLDMVGKELVTRITDEAVNEGLGILSISVDGNLTYRQQSKGMVCKVNIETTIGTFYGYTIWNSKFGVSLYGTAPTEGAKPEGDEAQRGSPAYRLSREATAQVLAFLHKQVDFTAKPEIPEGALEKAEQKKAEEQMAQQGFEPVADGAAFGAADK